MRTDGPTQGSIELILALRFLLSLEILDHILDHILGIFIDDTDHELAENGVDMLVYVLELFAYLIVEEFV